MWRSKEKSEMGHSEMSVGAGWSEKAIGHPRAVRQKELKSEVKSRPKHLGF